MSFGLTHGDLTLIVDAVFSASKTATMNWMPAVVFLRRSASPTSDVSTGVTYVFCDSVKDFLTCLS